MCGVAATTTVRHSHQPPPLCALPRPVRCVCVCWWWDWAQRRTVVARTLVWRCAWRLTTTPTSHAVHACRLSPLSCPQTHPPTHTQMALLTPHTHGVLCVPRPIHSLTHWLPHCPHTLHTHWWVCVCSSTCSHAPSHTQRRHRRGACLAALVLWSPPPRPLCHTHTQGLVVGAMVVVGGGRVGTVWLPRHATHSPCLPPHTPHPPPHTPWRVVCLARLATPTTTTQPHHTHTTTATVPQWWLPLVTTPSTHTPHLPHTRHTHTKGKHRRGCGFWCGTTTTLVLAIRCLLFFPSCPPTPFSLSLLHALTPPHPLINNTTIPSIPCVWCVCCGNGLMDGPHCG